VNNNFFDVEFASYPVLSPISLSAPKHETSYVISIIIIIISLLGHHAISSASQKRVIIVSAQDEIMRTA